MKVGMTESPILDYLLEVVGVDIDLLVEEERYFWEEGK